MFKSECDSGLETRETRSCGFMRGVNSMCCSRADEAAARWEEGARWAEEGNEDACFNRCPKNSRCNAKTKSCVCDIGYVMQGIECMSIKEGQDEELPLPGEVPVKKKTDRERFEDYEDPVATAKRKREKAKKLKSMGNDEEEDGAASSTSAGASGGNNKGTGLGRRFGGGGGGGGGGGSMRGRGEGGGFRIDRSFAIKAGFAATVVVQAVVAVALLGGKTGMQRAARRVKSQIFAAEDERRARRAD